MATEYINPQWRLPNEKTGNNQSYSMDFNGTNQYITLGSISNINTDFTVSGWINTTQTSLSGSAYRGWFSTGTFNNVGQFAISVSNSSSHGGVGFVNVWEENQLRIVGTSNVADGNWHHIVLVKTSAQLEIYVDGSLQNTASNTTTFTFPTAYIGIGAGGAGAGNQGKWDGKISQVCVFNYALSASQITNLYNGGTPFNPMALASPPIAYYPLGNSAHMGSNYLTPNGALQDYVFLSNGYPRKVQINLGSTFNNDMSELSVAMWIKKTDSTRTKDYTILQKIGSPDPSSFNLFYKRDQYASSGTNLAFHINTGSVQRIGGQAVTGNGVPLTIDNNVWYHVVGTYDGTTQSLYINGSLHDYKSTSGNITGVTYPMILNGGYGSANSTTYFIGEYSNVQLFDRGLTATDVETLYNNGSPIQTLANIPQNSNLKAWYKLDASEIYNSSSTEWEISDATAAIKLSTLQNSPGTGSGNAYTVSDSSGVINFPSSIYGTLKVSTSIWFYAPSSVSSGQYLQLLYAGPQSRLWLGFSGSNQLRAIIANGAWMYGNNVTMGQWNQITATINVVSSTRTVKFYINGQPAGTASQSGNPPISASDGITVSAYGYGTYSGQVLSSNSVFWDNVILTDAEVLSHYNSFSVSNGVPTLQPVLSSFPQSSSISGWYKLDGSFKDSSGNSRDATYRSHNNVGIGPSVSNNNGQSSGMTQSNLVKSDLLTTSSYSPYALNFDGNDHLTLGNNNYGFTSITSAGQTLDNLSISVWFKNSGGSSNQVLTTWWAVGTQTYLDGFLQYNPTNRVVRFGDDWQTAYTFPYTPTGWTHMVGVKTTNDAHIYVNGNLVSTKGSALSFGINRECRIGGNQGSGEYFVGGISNVSLWEYNLSALQIREIYNEGRPSNLHNFSGTAPVAWWQLGSNSSYASGWTCLDEIGSNDATSQSMLEDAIVNGVGASGNGTSTNMTTATNISGSSPNGEGNSLSVNMTLANIASGVN